MTEYFQAFLLGNGAILGNVCVLPLYPGLIAFLGGAAGDERPRRGRPFLGLVVLAGVLSVMLLLAWILFRLHRSFSSIFAWFLPIVFGLVLVLGVLLIAGRSPFGRMASSPTPLLRNPFAAAYLYGLLLGPMTLPCTGPLVISAFVLGAGNAGSLLDGILYFIAFGLGFGWPLVALPVLATPVQWEMTRWLTKRHAWIERGSGILLIGAATYAFWVDVLPNL